MWAWRCNAISGRSWKIWVFHMTRTVALSTPGATRLAQFVADHRRHGAGLDGWAAEDHLGERLLESANAVLLGGEDRRANVDAAALIVARELFAPTRALLLYWTHLNDPEWVDGAVAFPIACAVRWCLDEHGSSEDDAGPAGNVLGPPEPHPPSGPPHPPRTRVLWGA